ncbi:hypothetical protein FCV99_18905 [Escherichia coli]|nr:hypothetical protein [Escherichia coli]
MVNYCLISLALTQTLEEVIAHYKGDSRVVDANHDVFDYVMLRKEFTEDNQGNPTPEGQG